MRAQFELFLHNTRTLKFKLFPSLLATPTQNFPQADQLVNLHHLYASAHAGTGGIYASVSSFMSNTSHIYIILKSPT